MIRYGLFILLSRLLLTVALNLNYLDPKVLQTKTDSDVQRQTAQNIVDKYCKSYYCKTNVEIDRTLFQDNKDVFTLRTVNGSLEIRASSGVAAVWGFNYYLKEYCKSHIGWQVKRVVIPSPLPNVNETVVANDRFRYYQNVCTGSYSFVWWNVKKWTEHVEWMALNGINMALAPVAQEAVWSKIYNQIGMSDEEIDQHFTGPAFLAWFRMGNVRGWGGPLPKSWHQLQLQIQTSAVNLMFNLGMVPIFPSFSGHVPKAFARIYPNSTFYPVSTWNQFNSDYCCGLFLSPTDPLFKTIGAMFMKESALFNPQNKVSIFSSDPFNEIKIQPWSTGLVQDTAKAIFSVMTEGNDQAVWLLQGWMFVHDPDLWPLNRVKTFLTAVPEGRMLVLDLQSEQWPQYDLYQMYYGQPFIWNMLHNFGGTLGMFGNMRAVNINVHEVRSRGNTTMIGVGLTPEGINQNYVMYDLMLESAWRKTPIEHLGVWTANYAERRYGCNLTATGWQYLVNSVYDFNGLNRIRGKYAFTRRPSFRFQTWAWYKGHDLFEALRHFVFAASGCDSPGFYHDLVDVTRQALQYRTDQLHSKLTLDLNSNSWVFNASIHQFLDAMNDTEKILATNLDFTARDWFMNSRVIGVTSEEKYVYELNARNQITLWGPNGEISDYACKQWAELFHYYYIPRWQAFLTAALDAKERGETFDERGAQMIIRSTVEEYFLYRKDFDIQRSTKGDVTNLAKALYEKWAYIPGLNDLPFDIVRKNRKAGKLTTLADVTSEEDEAVEPSVVILKSTTPLL